MLSIQIFFSTRLVASWCQNNEILTVIFVFSSLPKKSHLEFVDDVSTSRSRSSDNLAKFPASSVSPLARRIANFESSHDSGKAIL